MARFESKADTNTWGSEFRLFNGIQNGSDDGLDEGRAGQAKAFMAEAWVYRCLDVKLAAAASVPLQVVQPDKKTGKLVPIPDHPALALLQRPNPLGYVIGTDLMKYSLGSLELHGETYWTFGNINGIPKEIFWRPVDIIEPVPSEDPRKFIGGYKFQTGQKSQPSIILPPEEVAYFHYPSHANPIRGIGKIETLRPYINLNIFALQTNIALHRNGSVPAWVLSTGAGVNETSKETLRTMITSWLSGPTKRGRPLVVSGDTKVQTIAQSATDGQWLQSQRMAQEAICAVFGVPLQLAGSQERSTMHNMEEAQTMFWHYTMIPWMDWWAEQMTSQLLWRVDPKHTELRFQFDYEAIEGLGDDVGLIWERVDRFMQRLDGQVRERVLTPDQARLLLAEAITTLGMDPAPYTGNVPFGSNFHAPFQNIPVEQLGVQTVIDIMAARGNNPQLEEDIPGAPNAAENALKPNPNPRPGAPTPNAPAPSPVPNAPKKSMEYGLKAAAAARSRDVRLTPVQKRLEGKFKRFFQKLQTEALRKLRGAKADVGNIQIKADAGDLYDQTAMLLELEQLVRDGILSSAEAAYLATAQDHGIDVTWDLHNAWVSDYMGVRAPLIQGINQTLQQNLQDALNEGTAAGETIDQLSQRVADVFRDQIDNNSTRIARTETIQAYARASIESYREGGLEMAEMYDGDNDDDANCAEVNGMVVTLDEAENLMSEEHPNGTRGVAPVVSAAMEGELEAASNPTILMLKAVRAIEKIATKPEPKAEVKEPDVKSEQFDQMLTLLAQLVAKEQKAPVVNFNPTIEAKHTFEKGALQVNMPEEKPKADLIVKHPDGRETRVKRG